MDKYGLTHQQDFPVFIPRKEYPRLQLAITHSKIPGNSAPGSTVGYFRLNGELRHAYNIELIHQDQREPGRSRNFTVSPTDYGYYRLKFAQGGKLGSEDISVSRLQLGLTLKENSKRKSTREVKITVTPPLVLQISNSTVMENLTPGSVVGEFDLDGDKGQTFFLTGIHSVSAGKGHSLFIQDNGELWGMGSNVYGQLGPGDTHHLYEPVRIQPSGCIMAAGGSLHSLFIKEDGSLWRMGKNEEGQLGEGDRTLATNPSQIQESGVTSVTAGANHSLFIRKDGSLWAMGENSHGQLGD